VVKHDICEEAIADLIARLMVPATKRILVPCGFIVSLYCKQGTVAGALSSHSNSNFFFFKKENCCEAGCKHFGR